MALSKGTHLGSYDILEPIQDSLTFEREDRLPVPPFFQTGNGYRTYDFTPDGKTILMILLANEPTSVAPRSTSC